MGGGGGSKPKPPKPAPKLAPAITEEDEAVQAAYSGEAERLRKRRGRAATLMAGPEQDGQGAYNVAKKMLGE